MIILGCRGLDLKRTIIPLTAFTLIFLCGCSIIRFFPDDSRILLVDDFSQPKYGWNVWKSESGSAVSYYEGGLVFIINTPNFDIISSPDGIFPDARIEVLGTKLVGPDNNVLGVICRYQDEKNYYGFLISSDGYYGILKVMDGNYKILNSVNMEFSEIIKKGSEMNHIRADCKGPSLVLSVNGTRLAETVDNDFTSGKVGLIVGSYKETGIALLFDNFMVLKP